MECLYLPTSVNVTTCVSYAYTNCSTRLWSLTVLCMINIILSKLHLATQHLATHAVSCVLWMSRYVCMNDVIILCPGGRSDGTWLQLQLAVIGWRRWPHPSPCPPSSPPSSLWLWLNISTVRFNPRHTCTARVVYRDLIMIKCVDHSMMIISQAISSVALFFHNELCRVLTNHLFLDILQTIEWGHTLANTSNKKKWIWLILVNTHNS